MDKKKRERGVAGRAVVGVSGGFGVKYFVKCVFCDM